MTRFSEKEIKAMRDSIVGKKVIELYYESEDDYFVMTFEDGVETCFRFMTDLIKQKWGI